MCNLHCETECFGQDSQVCPLGFDKSCPDDRSFSLIAEFGRELFYKNIVPNL